MRVLESDSGLTIRSQSMPAEKLSTYSPEQTRLWIAALPRANIGETAKQIYTRLCISNKQPLQPGLRAGLLIALQPETERLQENFEKHFLKASISLNPKQRKIAELTRALLNEQALGFKAIVDYYLSDPESIIKKKLLGASLAYAIYYTSRLIGHCYQLYLAPPAQLWKELHHLFSIALQNNLDHFEIDIPKPARRVTLRTLYKSSLLLALSHPNELRTHEFWAIQFDSLDFARKLRLNKKFDDGIEYVVNLDSSAAPFHRSLITTDISDNHLGINVQPLLFYLQSLIGSSSAEKKSSLSPNLIRHLITAIGNMATRAFSRIPSADSIEVSIGLAATHALIQKGVTLSDHSPLQDGDALTALAGSLKNVQVLDTEDTMGQHNTPPVKNGDAWSRMYQPKVSVNESADIQINYHMNPLTDAQRQLPKDYRLLPAAILDISPGGYRLKLEGELPKQTQTDEIIGLLEADDLGGHQWNIGIIRWIQRTNASELNAGVQLISPNAQPVLSQLKTVAKTSSSEHRSLLLPSLPHIGQPATLITPTIPYEIGKIVCLNYGNKIVDVKLLELMQAGRSYSRYTFSELSKQNVTSSAKGSNRNNPDDFAGVWEIL